MNFTIKIATTEAESDVARLEKAVAKVATATDTVTAASKRMNEAGSGTSTKLTKAANDAISAIAREAEIIERIRGPMREYRADMDALDALYKRNKLSLVEYTNEMDRLIAKQGTMHGPDRIEGTGTTAPGGNHVGLLGSLGETKIGKGLEAIAPLAGDAGEALVGLATKGTVAGAVLIGLGLEAVHLGNEYLELANKAQKLTAAGGSVNETLREQMGLSLQLHGSLDATIELYDAVRDGTDELNLSQREQIQLTKDIGSAVVASGKSVEAAGGLMSKLTFAFSSGSIGGRELKGIMKEFPDIGSAFVSAMGHSRKELIAMANDGQLSSDMLIAAFNKMGPEMEAKVGRKAETSAQMFGHFKDELTLSLGRVVESSGAFKLLNGALESLAGVASYVADGIEIIGNNLWAIAPVFKVMVESVKLTKDAFVGLVNVATSAWSTVLNPVLGAAEEQRQKAIAQAYLDRMEALKLLGVEEERNARTAEVQRAALRVGVLPPSQRTFDEGSANKWAEARITLKQMGIDIGAAFSEATTKAMSLDAEVEKIKQGKAASDIADQAKRIAHELSGANDVLETQDKSWQAVLDKATEYGHALDKIKADHAHFPGMMITKDDVDIVRGARDATLEAEVGQNRYAKAIIDAKHKTNEHKDALNDLSGAYKQGSLSWKEYTDGLRALGVEESELAKMMKASAEAAKHWTGTMDALDYMLSKGKFNARQYNDEIAKLTATLKVNMDETKLPSYVGPKKIGGIDVAVSADVRPNYGLLTDEETGKTGDLSKYAAKIQTTFGPMDEWIRKQAELQDSLRNTAEETEKVAAANDFITYSVQNGLVPTEEQIAQAAQVSAALRDRAELLRNEQGILEGIRGPQKAYADQQAALDALLAASSISAEQYNRALDENRAKLLAATPAGKTFSGGMELALLKMKQDTEAFGATLANTLVGDIGTFSDAIVTAANGGEVAWGKMVDSMIMDIEKLILKQLMMQAIMAGMSALGIGGGAGGLVEGIAGAATGADWTVGGSGGTDSKIAAFRVTPGEHIAVRTPQQMSAGAYPFGGGGGSGGGQPAAAPQVVNKIINVYDKSQIHAAMSDAGGQQVTINTLRQNQPAVRGNQRR